MIRAVPLINTSRLTLRPLRMEDFARFADIWADPDVARHVFGQPRSRGQSWRAFVRIAGQWQLTGFGQWAIEDRASGKMIGQPGFFNGGRDLGADFDPFPETGWVLASEAQGKGLGGEATTAVHDWYDRVIPGPLVCMVTPENETSLKLAGALGYSDLRMAEFDGTPVQLMRRDKAPQR